MKFHGKLKTFPPGIDFSNSLLQLVIVNDEEVDDIVVFNGYMDDYEISILMKLLRNSWEVIQVIHMKNRDPRKPAYDSVNKWCSNKDNVFLFKSPKRFLLYLDDFLKKGE